MYIFIFLQYHDHDHKTKLHFGDFRPKMILKTLTVAWNEFDADVRPLQAGDHGVAERELAFLDHWQHHSVLK